MSEAARNWWLARAELPIEQWRKLPCAWTARVMNAPQALRIFSGRFPFCMVLESARAFGCTRTVAQQKRLKAKVISVGNLTVGGRARHPW